MRGGLLGIAVVAACGGGHAASPDAPLPPDAAQPYFLPGTTYAGVPAPTGIAVGDVDGDGVADLVVAGVEDTVSSFAVLHGLGSGTFDAPTAYGLGDSLPLALAVADLDGDGLADVAVTDAENRAVLVARATALGNIARYTVGEPWPLSITATDVDGDGHRDLVTADNLGGGGISVLLGDGTGGFTAMPTEPAGSFPQAVAAADLDGDGKLDLAVADQGPIEGDSTTAVMLGHGDGTFATPTMFEVGNFPDSIAVADLNGDSLLDLVISNEYDGTTSVLLATGGGQFAPQQRYQPSGSSTAVADLDGDGRPELIVANGDLTILHNAGDGTFDASWTVACGCGRVAIADLNGDGKLDLAGIDFEQEGAAWESPGNLVTVLLHR